MERSSGKLTLATKGALGNFSRGQRWKFQDQQIAQNLATSKLLMAFKLPFATNANLALVAPISPNKTELDMWGSARRKCDISGR